MRIGDVVDQKRDLRREEKNTPDRVQGNNEALNQSSGKYRLPYEIMVAHSKKEACNAGPDLLRIRNILRINLP